LRITVEGEPRDVGLCHCLACLPWVQLPPGAAAFDKDPD
jgi:hypothetical protein